jgi:putative DNA primase/helicase
VAAKKTAGTSFAGLVLTGLEHVACLDLDHCGAPINGQLADWAQALLAKLPPTYIEVSLSGHGLHVFGTVAPDVATGTFVLKRGSGDEKIEVYVRATRAVVVTDRVFGPRHPLADISAAIQELMAERAGRRGAHNEKPNGPDEPPDLDGLPPEIVKLIIDGAPADADHSEQLFRAVAVLREYGRSRAAIIAVLRAHPNGVANKCFEHGRDEIERHVDLILREIDDRRAAAAARSPRPAIRLDPDRLTEVAAEVEAAMLASGQPVYEHGDGRLVHPIKTKTRGANNTWTITAALAEIGVPLMRQFMASAAMFKRLKYKHWVGVEPPEPVAKLILGRRGFWPFPRIRGVITTPTLRPDGSLLAQPGFDAETGLFLFDPPPMPPMPEAPTKDHAIAAMAELKNDLLAEFPFVDGASRSVGLSTLVTPTVRGLFDVTPMHATSAPAPGSGKSYLIDLASVMISGHRCATSTWSRNEEENEKRLGGTLLQGYPLLSLDNINAPLNSPFLCTVIERTWLEVRILGTSQKPRLSPQLTLFATGNNLVLVGDLVRRTLLAQLDAQCEQPWTRQFKSNPLALLLADRGRYISAALTVVRAYLAAGAPSQGLAPFASFESWSETVRSALVWLGEADPVKSVTAQYEQDPDRLNTAMVFAAWRDQVGLGIEITTANLITRATGGPTYIRNDELFDALFAVAGEKGTISGDRLSRWLRIHKDQIVNGLRLQRTGITSGRARWQVIKV